MINPIMPPSEDKIAIIADAHLGQYLKTKPTRGIKLIDWFCKTIDRIRTDGFDTLFILGDLLHVAQLDTEAMLYIKDVVTPHFSKFKRVVVVLGNHEALSDIQSTKQRSILELIFPNLEIYIDLINTISTHDTNFLCIPYQHSVDTIWAVAHEHMVSDKKNIILGHLTPNEFFSFAKFQMEPFVKLYTESGFNVPYILLGDYHPPVDVKILNTTMYSVGSTYYWNIEDIKKKSGKRFLTYQNGKITSHDINLPEILSFELQDQNLESLDISLLEKHKEAIIHIISNRSLDLTQLIIDGFDVYHEYSKNKVSDTLRGVSLEKCNITDVNAFWEKYSSGLDKTNKKIADRAFLDKDITPQNLLELVMEDV